MTEDDALRRKMQQREQWLSRRREEILEPELPICDPHHHLWDYPYSRYLMDELLADTASGHNVVATVFVECSAFYRAHGPEALRPVGETEFVNGHAAMSASGRYGPTRHCAAIVGFADLCLGDAVEEVLEAHIVAGGGTHGRFRGIRHAGAWDANPEIRNSHTHPQGQLFLDPTFRQGFAHLAPMNMSFEGWLYHRQIPELTDLARAFPDTRIILDHFGGPLGIGPYAGKQEEILVQWRADVAKLAKCENVVAKLGGLGMTSCGFGFHKRDEPPGSEALAECWRPYMDHTIDCFGPARCMFESNFPVDKASCSYRTIWNAFKHLAQGYSAAEKAAMFHDTAARVYRLDR